MQVLDCEDHTVYIVTYFYQTLPIFTKLVLKCCNVCQIT